MESRMLYFCQNDEKHFELSVSKVEKIGLCLVCLITRLFMACRITKCNRLMIEVNGIFLLRRVTF